MATVALISKNINPLTMKLKNILIPLTIVLALLLASLWWYYTNVTLANKELPAITNFNTLITNNLESESYTLPTVVTFAGEEVPVQNYDVYESLDRELLINSYWHSSTWQVIKLSKKYFPMIEPILKKNGVPDDFKYLAAAESGLRNLTSPSGAKGYWQFLDKTAISYGLEVNEYVDERLHIEKSTEAACKYFKEAYKQFGNWSLVAASYNMGRTGVAKQLERQKVDNYYDLLLNSETARYMFRLISFKIIMENPNNFGFDIDKNIMYKYPETVEIEVDTTIYNLILFARSQNTNYKLLNNLNPWLVTDKLNNPKKKKYYFKIPVESARKIY